MVLVQTPLYVTAVSGLYRQWISHPLYHIDGPMCSVVREDLSKPCIKSESPRNIHMYTAYKYCTYAQVCTRTVCTVYTYAHGVTVRM